jgi:hypothetical protein
VRKAYWALILGAVVLWFVGFAAYVGLVGNPAIARMKGEVISVEPVDDETEICLSEPMDAGSTHGDREYDNPECRRGLLESRVPSVADCVILKSQGHVSEIEVEAAEDYSRPALPNRKRIPVPRWAGSPS